MGVMSEREEDRCQICGERIKTGCRKILHGSNFFGDGGVVAEICTDCFDKMQDTIDNIIRKKNKIKNIG
jgi:hypothetical protein